MTDIRLGIDPAAVKAAVALDDLASSDSVAGRVACSLGMTRGAVATLVPREWEEVAAYLFALIAMPPLKESAAFQAHRIALGTLADELRGYAHAAGEPVGLNADLRDAASKAEEQRIRARLADEAAAFDRHIDDVLISQSAQRAATYEEIPTDESQAAAPAPETDDDPLSYL